MNEEYGNFHLVIVKSVGYHKMSKSCCPSSNPLYKGGFYLPGVESNKL